VNATDLAPDQLPPGIFFRSGERPPHHWRGVVFNVVAGAEKPAVRDALARLWQMWSELARGRVRDLAKTREDDPNDVVTEGDLTVLLGIGRSLFGDERHMPQILSGDLRPSELARLFPGPNQPFPKLHWAADAAPQQAQGDFFVQLFGSSALVVNRAIVEAQKLIDDFDLPLRMGMFYRGAHREDGRSWIDFHDGINNMPANERRAAIEFTSADAPWLVGGTFAIFLRIHVDLKVWRSLTREQQELLVGRHKLTGCPLTSASIVDGRPVLDFQPGCPVANANSGQATAEFTDPPPAAGLVKTSHIHRSNFNRGSPGADGNNRIFRQGYEFLEPNGDGALHVGLNFISFQRSLKRVRNILTTGGWMGDVNFGGSTAEAGAPPIPLMSVLAGGLYAVPPRADPFPGWPLFA